MPSKTAKQAKFMRAVAHGFKPDRVEGPTRTVAREFMKEDQKKKKPMKKAMGGRIMGGNAGRMMGRGQTGPIATADRTLRAANTRLAGMPGAVQNQMGMKPAYAKGGLSRMHFKRGADIIKGARERAKAAGATDFSHIDDINSEMERWFKESNPNFKRDRYRKAAGYED